MDVVIVYPGCVVSINGFVTLGGAEIYAADLARLCRQLGHTPRILQFSATSSNSIWEGIPIHTRQWAPGMFARKPRRVVRRLLSELGLTSALIVFCSEAVAHRVRGFHAALVQHGIGIDYPTPGRGIPWIRRALAWPAVHALVRAEALWAGLSVDSIVCVDYVYPTWLRTFRPKLAIPTRTIPNYARVPRGQPVSRDSFTRVVFARRMVERRGARTMAEVAQQLLKTFPSVTVTFAGEGPLRDEIGRQLSAEQRVRFESYRPGIGVDFHSGFDIAVVPSLASEGTSLSLLEAMAAGCAVVATPVGGLPNIVIDRYNGLIALPEPSAIAAAVAELIVRPHMARRFAERGFETVRDGFSYDVWVDRWAAWLTDVSHAVQRSAPHTNEDAHACDQCH